MLSNARALTVLVVAINATLWLYAAGALTTLLFRVVLKLASCADPETCHLPVGDGVSRFPAENSGITAGKFNPQPF
jgi:hypothetical protein